MYESGLAERVAQVVATAADPGSLADAVLCEQLVALDRIDAQLLAARARLTAEWDARQVWAADGAVSGGAWLAHRGETSRADAHAQVREAGRLRHMPSTMEALAAGEIGAAKARLLARCCTPELADVFGRDEALLVGHARTFTVDQFAQVVRRWRRVNRDDRAQLDRDHAELYLSPTYDGVHDVRGRLDPEGGVIVRRGLDSIGHELYQAEIAATGAPARTPAQRRAAALVEMAVRAAAVDISSDVLPRPTLLAICDAGLLAGTQGEPPGFASICEIDGIGAIPADTGRRLACNAAIFDVVIGADGKLLDVGRSRRLATPAQRKALLVRDQHCVFPGCDRPAHWCEAHHIHPYEHGGPTDLANLCLLCSHHHHLVHEGGYGLGRRPDGRLTFTRPDHTPIHTDRPNHLPLRLASCRGRPRGAGSVGGDA